MNMSSLRCKLLAVALATATSLSAHAGVDLIAIGSISGSYEDLSNNTAAPLENGVAGNRLGGLGSGLAYAGGETFLAVPDRGPNAVPYASSIDDTVSYINRFQTLNLSLAPNPDYNPSDSSSLPFVLTPTLRNTTLLSSVSPLVYGTGAGLTENNGTPIGSGQPAINTRFARYFTGRSDNFDASKPSTTPSDARLDSEGIRVSNDGLSVFISDEYGPYVYQFNRFTGQRVRSFKLPDNLAITTLSPRKDVEIASNSVGRVTNKGMEGLAITPDGKTLVGIMQANLEQDKKGSLRIVTIDIQGGATHEYGYKLTDGSGVSEIVAVNNHQFLVDERDGNGMADTPLLTDTASAALVKKLYLIDLNGAQDVSGVAVLDLKNNPSQAVHKEPVPFLDIVAKLTAAGIDAFLIPSKLEGLAFGQDVVINGETRHTMYVANDNDFLATIADPLKSPTDPTRGMVPNPNQFYVFAFSDSDLPGYVPQPIAPRRLLECGLGN
jgi:hypothetical protein